MTISREEFRKLKSVTKEDDERIFKEEKKKEYMCNWRENNKDKVKEQHKQYYEENKEEIKEHAKQYYEDHVVGAREYYQEHKGEKKEYDKQYKEENKEKLKLDHAEYLKTEKGKAAMNRFQSKRRGLGSLELNEPFEGSVAHHINKNTIVYVPKELHQSIYHNSNTGQGMVEINNAVVEWLIDIGELMPMPR